MLLVSVRLRVLRMPLPLDGAAAALFGLAIPSVETDLRYRIEYNAAKTPDFNARVFEYPTLARANATLTFPALPQSTNGYFYMKCTLPPKTSANRPAIVSYRIDESGTE